MTAPLKRILPAAHSVRGAGQYDLDTLRDRKFLSHFNAKRLFAITAMYKLADKTISVVIPQMIDHADIAVATKLYDRFMAEDPDLKQQVHVTEFDGKSWRVGQEIGAHYQPHVASIKVERPL